MGKFRKVEIVEIDGFELRKFGTLKKREEEWIEQFYAGLRASVTKPALELGEWITANEGKTEAQAMEFIESLESMRPAEQMATMMRYKKALPDIIEALQSAPQRQKDAPKHIATWALNERLPEGWIGENRNELRNDLGIDAAGTEWLPEWTDELGEDTIQAIYSFVLKERNGWLSVAAEFAPKTDEPEEEKTLGEDLPPSVSGDQPTGGQDGPLSPPLELSILSSAGDAGTIALAI
jgi:hypothetical protein